MNTLIVLAGPPGCGKSTACKELLGFKVVSSDAIRAQMFGDESNQDNPSLVFSTVHHMIKNLLDNGEDVVFDATNCRREYRLRALEDVTDRLRTRSVCMVYTGDLESCLERNASRARKVPEKVIKRMFYELKKEPPNLLEGFDAVISMDRDVRCKFWK
jgi:predicted kinase